MLTGTGLLGISSASGGNGSQDSSTNYPVLQLRRLDNEQCAFLSYDPAVNVSATSLRSLLATSFSGYALATVFTNGIPSVSTMVSYVLPLPSVTAISPTTGSSVGGTAVTLTGTNFTGTSTVTFGGTPAASFTVNSDTSITATTPGHAVGTVDVAVTNSYGSGTGTGLFTFTALSFTTDTDGDGMSDGSEFNMAALGFNWQV